VREALGVPMQGVLLKHGDGNGNVVLIKIDQCLSPHGLHSSPSNVPQVIYHVTPCALRVLPGINIFSKECYCKGEEDIGEAPNNSAAQKIRRVAGRWSSEQQGSGKARFQISSLGLYPTL
jgi:hypothetical protein